MERLVAHCAQLANIRIMLDKARVTIAPQDLIPRQLVEPHAQIAQQVHINLTQAKHHVSVVQLASTRT